tara:strand:+ start:637 stop:855 length:219 start_codon:yes stop_codon:yes gene_type:complete
MTGNHKKLKPVKQLTPEETEKKKQYFRDYYIRRKKEKGIKTGDPRGRKAKPIIEQVPEKIINKDEPYIVYFD